MPKKNFYAVRKGTILGIYQTWAECQEVTKGFPGAEYLGFVTLGEAEAFINEQRIQRRLKRRFRTVHN